MKRNVILAGLVVGACFALTAQAGENEPDPATAKIQRILATKKVSFDFVEAPLADVLAFQRALLGVNIVMAPAAKKLPPLTLRVENMTARNGLLWVAFLCNAKLAIRNGAIHVAPVAPAVRKPPPLDKGPLALRVKELFAKRLSFDFVETPLQDVLSFIGTLADVNIIVDRRIFRVEPPSVTLKVNDISLGNAVYWIAVLCDLKIELRGGAIFVARGRPKAEPAKVAKPDPAKDPDTLRIKKLLETKRISFDFVETPIADVVAFLGTLVEVTIILAPDVPRGTPVTLKVENMKLDSALRWTTRLIGGKIRLHNEAIFITREGKKPTKPKAPGKRRPTGGHL